MQKIARSNTTDAGLPALRPAINATVKPVSENAVAITFGVVSTLCSTPAADSPHA